MKKVLLFAVVFSGAMALAFAGENKEDFSSEAMPENWSAAKGEWAVADGSLAGKELATDKHAAVLTLPDSHADSTITFRFQNTGAKAFHLSYNHSKGHLFRIKMDGVKADLILDKNKKDPTSKPVVLASGEFSLDRGEWYTVTCTVKGDTVEAKCGDTELKGSHPNLTKEKTGYRFIVQGDGVLIDDVSYSSSK